MRFIFIGDVVGRGGREAVRQLVPELRREYNAQFVIVNGENSAGGNGLTGSCLRELLHSCDVVTSGDHTWDQKGFEQEISNSDRIIRPANYHRSQPGRGCGVFANPAGGRIAVVALAKCTQYPFFPSFKKYRTKSAPSGIEPGSVVYSAAL